MPPRAVTRFDVYGRFIYYFRHGAMIFSRRDAAIYYATARRYAILPAVTRRRADAAKSASRHFPGAGRHDAAAIYASLYSSCRR